MEPRTGFKLGKVYIKAVYCHPAYITYMQNTSWETLGWKQHKLESRLLGEIITSDIQMIPPYGRKQRGTKKLLDKVERGEWKIWLKTQHSKNKDHGIWAHHFMANVMGKQCKHWQTLFSWAQESLRMVTAAMKLKDTCSLEEKIWQT